ncbi:tetratricopeptide repeat protein [Massilia sp. DD77]|uniref:tetratricopeptide repeat protein n=1 Tax=Massilia sp. DD77 TaxID=3109349 RepID=UPI003000A02F
MPRPVHRFRSSARAALAASFMLAAPAMATPYGDALKARNYLEAERLADAALAAAPRDPLALAAKVDVIVATAPEARVDEAVSLGEACVAAHPRESACHAALGTALGSKAVGAGIFSAMGYAGKIRDAFRKAVDLDPGNVDARFLLLQYYLMAPGIVGGGVDKGRALAAETARRSPEAAQLMQARIAAREDEYALAERLARAVNAAPGSDLAEQRRDALWALGMGLLMEKRHADSERIFRELQAAYPNSELGLYGQARLRQEQGRHAEAIPLLEQAAKVYPQGAVYYRLGQSLQAGGNKAKALGAYEKALGAVPALSKKQSADAGAQIKILRQ